MCVGPCGAAILGEDGYEMYVTKHSKYVELLHKHESGGTHPSLKKAIKKDHKFAEQGEAVTRRFQQSSLIDEPGTDSVMRAEITSVILILNVICISACDLCDCLYESRRRLLDVGLTYLAPIDYQEAPWQERLRGSRSAPPSHFVLARGVSLID